MNVDVDFNAEPVYEVTGDSIQSSVANADEVKESKTEVANTSNYSNPEGEEVEDTTAEVEQDSDTDKEVKEEDKAEVEAQEEQHKRKTGSQREKERRKALEDKLERVESELRAMKAGSSTDYQAPSASQQSYNPNREPQLADFNSVEEWANARDQFRDQKQREYEIQKEWAKKEEVARKKYEDYDDAVEDLLSYRPSLNIVNALQESPIGPELVHYLGSNPEEVKRINALSPSRQVVELGKLEVKLAEPKKVIQKSKAPAPINTVKPVAAIAPPKNKDNYIVY